jgi:D-sedoheptulose 7-phosphate isomerase
MFQNYRKDVITALGLIEYETVQRAADVLRSAQALGSSVFIIGNGGSAATASHFANDLVKACGIKAYSLPDMVPLITAMGNDEGWEEMYSRLLAKFLSPSGNDVVVAISCSGNSPNIVDPMIMLLHYPRVRTIALIGSTRACDVVLEGKPEVVISVPFRDIKVQEDCHMIICHAIAGALNNAPSKTKGIL